ncbi:MAG: type II toxin-antitoxin system VapC family toxin [Dysgonamonadaceae bacterium]|jgi:PIN domain nuclease of toxin-antitoxin system|nr:type II toxin-antitoxin system VapC family toxin [Dysgonamonadaceae bacterium]
MTCLIDTHTFIWSISDTGKLSSTAREILIDNGNTVFVSVVSFWEIALKTSIKKFIFEGIINSKLPEYSEKKMGFHIAGMTAIETSTFADLPLNK